MNDFMEDRKKALVAIILSSLLGGATVPLSKLGLQEFPPLSFAFIRFLLSAMLILPFILKYKRGFLGNFQKLLPLSLLATINIIFFILGIKTTTATSGILLYAAVPVLAGLLGYILFRHKLPSYQLIGLILGFIGVFVIVFLPILEKGNPFSGDLLGNLLIAVGVITWSFYMVLSRKTLLTFSPFVMTAVFIFLTALALFPLFIFESLTNTLWFKNVTLTGVFSLIYVATISTILTYFLGQYAIKHGGIVFASMTFYLVPVVGYIFSFLLLGELLTLGLVLGGVLALIGVFLVTKN